MKPASLIPAIVLLLAVFSGPVRAAEDHAAQAWLMKMQYANKKHSYVGTFVYRHGQQMEAMSIAHRVRAGKVLERIVSLNGSAREVVRDHRIERIYMPDKKMIQTNRRTENENEFPALLTRSMKDFQNHYQVMLGNESRIANRMAQMVIIKPRDDFRYGYRLWADRKTGLLLRADLVNMQGKSLEQYMFTSIRIGGPVPANLLQPQMSTRGAKIKKHADKQKPPKVTMSWGIEKPPRGFQLSSKSLGICPAHNTPVQHMVYTDGLASVSVFIEKAGKKHNAIKGLNQMGAIHAFGKIQNGYQITVVGQVPADTVRRFGNTVYPVQLSSQ